MKKVLIALGAAFLGLVVLGGAMLAAGYTFVQSHEGEGKTYVDAVVQRIAKDWDDAALMAEASPEMLHVASRDQIRALFQTFGERLGALKGYGGATRETYFVNFTMSGRVLTLTHTAPAVFENGPATIRVRTIRRDGQWKVLDFYVQSEALVREPGGVGRPKRAPAI